MNHPTVTIAGNLAADPELAFAPNGLAYTRFCVMQTPRSQGADGEWHDGVTGAYYCVAFRGLAVNVGESLVKGVRVLVVGRFVATEWADKTTGEIRRGQEIHVEEIGASLRYALVSVRKPDRSNA